MRLHYAPNTIAVATAIALEEAGHVYEPLRVDFAAGAQKEPAYLAINPKARVPALEVNGDILTETGALLEFLVPDLVPTDPIEAAKTRAVMYYLASTMHVNHAHKRRGSRWADHDASLKDMSAKVPETMTACAAYVEAECLVGPYILGQSLCVADPYLFVVCNWLPGDGVAVADFPKISAFLTAMEARDSVKAVRAKGILT